MSEYVDLAVKMVTREWDFMMWIIVLFAVGTIYEIIFGKGGRTEETPPEFQDTKANMFKKNMFDPSDPSQFYYPTNYYHNFDE